MDNLFISTGFESLNKALGCGGFPSGRVTEISGSGTQEVAIATLIAAQARGITCAYIDGRHSFDAARAQARGCDLGDLLIAQPDHHEQAIGITEILAKSGAVGLIVVEIETMLTFNESLGLPREEYSDVRALSHALRVLTATAAKTDSAVIFLRSGKLVPCQSINNALKFYASLRIETQQTGTMITAKVVKNKLAPSFATASFQVAA